MSNEGRGKKKVAQQKVDSKAKAEPINTEAEESHPNQKFTDEELKEALIEANGRPTKAAELLGVAYPTVYLRIRSNHDIKAVQLSYRSRMHQTLSDIAERVALLGVIREPRLDDDGDILTDEKGEIVYRDRRVDYGTRINTIMKLADNYKGADGIIDEIKISTDGDGVDIGDWLSKVEELRRAKANEKQDK